MADFTEIRKQAGDVTMDDLLAKAQTFMALHPVEPLPITEVKHIASSIVRNGARYKTRAVRNYGAMTLAPVDYSALEADERLAVIRERQAIGARFVNSKRKAGTMARLAIARDELVREGGKVTQKAVAAKAGVSIRSVKVYWQEVMGQKVQTG